MNETTTAARMTTLPGAGMLARLRRLLIVAVVCALGSMMFIHRSKGGCGDVDDGSGAPTVTCATLTLRANPIIAVIAAVVVIWAISRALRWAGDEAAAIRLFDRTTAFLVILTLAGLVISYVWFALTPLPVTGETFSIFSPFPFASIEVDIQPSGR